MDILLINDNSDQPNWGAIATSCALRQLIEDNLPGASISALSSRWLTRSYRQLRVPFGWGPVFAGGEATLLQLVLKRFSREDNTFPRVVDDFDYCAGEWLNGHGGEPAEEFLSLAKKADVIIYNGENSIYRNTEEGCRGLFLLWLSKTRLGRPSAIVNHTAQLDDVRPLMRAMVESVYPVLDLAAVREPRSYQNLLRLGLQNVELFPDVVFSFKPGDSHALGFERWRESAGLGRGPYFCLSGSALPASSPRNGWDGAITCLVRRLLTVLNRGVLLAKDASCQFLEEVARRTGCVYFGPEHDFRELWPLLQGASVQVTGHFHNVIIGATVGCPFVPLTANNHKMQGVCDHLEWHRQEPFDITFVNRETDGIIEEVRRLLANREAHRSHLLRRTEELRSEVQRLGRRITEIAGCENRLPSSSA